MGKGTFKIVNTNDHEYEDALSGDLSNSEDYELESAVFSRSMDEYVKIFKSLPPEEIIAVLNRLDMRTRRKIIVGLKLSVNPLGVNYGQVVKYIYNGEEKYGCVIGGGQKLKLCVIDSDLNTYVKIDRYDILDTLPDRLHVKKQGKYRWPIKKHHNEIHYEDNQKVIAKYEKR